VGEKCIGRQETSSGILDPLTHRSPLAAYNKDHAQNNGSREPVKGGAIMPLDTLQRRKSSITNGKRETIKRGGPKPKR